MSFVFKKGIFLSAVFMCLISCNKHNINADAFGSFESENIILSAQISGMILHFTAQEGQNVNAGDYIATIDTTELTVQKKKLELQLDAFLTQHTNIPDKFKVLHDSLLKINHAVSNISAVSKNAVLQAEWDNLLVQKKNIEDEIVLQKKSFSTQVKLLAMQAEQLYLQLEEVNKALSKCKVVSPINGTLLTKYVHEYELIGAGFSIVRLADLSQMNLKVYVTEDQLSSIGLGAECLVYIDDEEADLKEYQGIITWISNESEFTPKMIQTKKERVNLVYAVKIKVENDGAIKTGMPGEVVFK
jgi:HlyD family secretion protein